jgi:hypothetical protein
METAMLNEVRDTFAPAQLATALLNFGVGKMAIPNQIRCPGQTFYYESP